MKRDGDEALERLVERAREGDGAAFGQLVDLEGDRCYRTAYRILRNEHRAQDAVQQAFLLAWQQIPTLRDAQRFQAWLYRLLVNACYQEARNYRRWSGHVREIAVELAGQPGEPSVAGDPQVSVVERDALEQAFRVLSPEQRAVFVLHHHTGFPLTQIGEILGIPLGTVKSRLHYATRSLRAAVTEEALPAIGEARPA